MELVENSMEASIIWIKSLLMPRFSWNKTTHFTFRGLLKLKFPINLDETLPPENPKNRDFNFRSSKPLTYT